MIKTGAKLRDEINRTNCFVIAVINAKTAKTRMTPKHGYLRTRKKDFRSTQLLS